MNVHRRLVCIAKSMTSLRSTLKGRRRSTLLRWRRAWRKVLSILFFVLPSNSRRNCSPRPLVHRTSVLGKDRGDHRRFEYGAMRAGADFQSRMGTRRKVPGRIGQPKAVRFSPGAALGYISGAGLCGRDRVCEGLGAKFSGPTRHGLPSTACPAPPNSGRGRMTAVTLASDAGCPRGVTCGIDSCSASNVDRVIVGR
jgi:hypothetical protein